MDTQELIVPGNALKQGIVHMVGYNNGKYGCYMHKSPFDSSGGVWYDWDDLEPIEITEDIISKHFTLIQRNGWNMYELYFNGECTYHIKFWDETKKLGKGLESIDLEICDVDGSPGWWADGWDEGDTKYIHQLQNLYQILAKKPLTYWCKIEIDE
jgi:hypothetical protein